VTDDGTRLRATGLCPATSLRADRPLLGHPPAAPTSHTVLRQSHFLWDTVFAQDAIRLAPGVPLQLYDVVKDTGEKQNVAKDHPEVVAKVEGYLKTARTESKQWPITAPKKKK
jgi:hypothetical protein